MSLFSKSFLLCIFIWLYVSAFISFCFLIFVRFSFRFWCFAGTKKMEYKTRQWHEKCFSCCVCKNPIGTKSYVATVHNYSHYTWAYYAAADIFDIICYTYIQMFYIFYSFIPKEQEIYCAGCYEEKYATRCIKCSKVYKLFSNLLFTAHVYVILHTLDHTLHSSFS